MLTNSRSGQLVDSSYVRGWIRPQSASANAMTILSLLVGSTMNLRTQVTSDGIRNSAPCSVKWPSTEAHDLA